jgi:hypothetical protein
MNWKMLVKLLPLLRTMYRSIKIFHNSDTKLRQYKNTEYNIKVLIHITLYTVSQIPVVCPQSFSSLVLYGMPQNNPPGKDQHHILHNSTQTFSFFHASYKQCTSSVVYIFSDFGATFLMKCLSLNLGRGLSDDRRPPPLLSCAYL